MAAQTDPFQPIREALDQEIGRIYGTVPKEKGEAGLYARRQRLLSLEARTVELSARAHEPEHDFYRARIKMELGRYDEALPLWEQTLPDHTSSHHKLIQYHMAVCYRFLGAYANARMKLYAAKRQGLEERRYEKELEALTQIENLYLSHRLGARFFDAARDPQAPAPRIGDIAAALELSEYTAEQRQAITDICLAVAAASRPEAPEEPPMREGFLRRLLARDKAPAPGPQERPAFVEGGTQVFFAGFGWTGSGALFDYYRQCERASEPFGDAETTFFRSSEFRTITRSDEPEQVWDALVMAIERDVIGFSGSTGGNPRSCASKALVQAVGTDAHNGRKLAAAVADLLEAYRGGQTAAGFGRFLSAVANLPDREPRVSVFSNGINARLIDRIDHFPGGKVVVVTRDMRDVYASRMVEAGRLALPSERFINHYKRSLEAFEQAVAELAHPERVVMAGFEDFVTSASYRRELGAELGLDVDTIVEREGEYRPADSLGNVGVHRLRDDADDIKRIAEAFPDTLWDSAVSA
ncbi:hypothetical protein [Glycomyces sp. NRRL B-16210]|uniref:hypothetical protein n=1 Tax=Glycomyces sp. NRRL B-16210 TaxID=1463821 RepID=UPI000B099326|nr:hypothetical protein [Glycomyces sp. NRRL B-16210]